MLFFLAPCVCFTPIHRTLYHAHSISIETSRNFSLPTYSDTTVQLPMCLVLLTSALECCSSIKYRLLFYCTNILGLDLKYTFRASLLTSCTTHQRNQKKKKEDSQYRTIGIPRAWNNQPQALADLGSLWGPFFPPKSTKRALSRWMGLKSMFTQVQWESTQPGN